MPKTYLLKDESDINNGLYFNNKYLDVEGEDSNYYVEHLNNFQNTKDIILEVRPVC